jgi:hypothetical protein
MRPPRRTRDWTAHHEWTRPQTQRQQQQQLHPSQGHSRRRETLAGQTGTQPQLRSPDAKRSWR